MTLAFTFTSSHIYYVALTGTKAAPKFHERNKIALPANFSVPQTTSWFETQLDLLLNNLAPDRTVFKLTINNVTNSYVGNVYYAQAILNLLCFKKEIEITHCSPTSIVPSKFNQHKDTKLHDYLGAMIGDHPPYWDKVMKDTALISLAYLPEK